MNYEDIHEPVEVDPIGTIRVSQDFGTIAVYVKVNEDTWKTIYVDPQRNTHLAPHRVVSDYTAGVHPVAFVPKSVG